VPHPRFVRVGLGVLLKFSERFHDAIAHTVNNSSKFGGITPIRNVTAQFLLLPHQSSNDPPVPCSTRTTIPSPTCSKSLGAIFLCAVPVTLIQSRQCLKRLVRAILSSFA
jgi:hypothetical protein